MANKPKTTVIKFVGEDTGYYCVKTAYQPSTKEEATKLDRKTARTIQGKLKKLGYQTILETI